MIIYGILDFGHGDLASLMTHVSALDFEESEEPESQNDRISEPKLREHIEEDEDDDDTESGLLEMEA